METGLHTDDSRVSKAFSGVCVCVILSVCQGQRSRLQGHKVQKHIEGDRTKTAETAVTKLATRIVRHESFLTTHLILGQ